MKFGTVGCILTQVLTDPLTIAAPVGSTLAITPHVASVKVAVLVTSALVQIGVADEAAGCARLSNTTNIIWFRLVFQLDA